MPVSYPGSAAWVPVGGGEIRYASSQSPTPYPVGQAPNGQTIYSDGSRGWTQWQQSRQASYTPSSGGGSGGGGAPSPQGFVQPDQGQQQNYDPYAQVRNEISSGWDNYINSLGEQTGFINDQRTAQEGIANSQYDMGVNTANTQKAKSLRDIADTTRNAFQAGNNYLGSLGAGDSSAGNQYSFAINQQANKQTGNLNEYVSGQIANLGYQRDQQVQQVAQWFASAQQTLKQQISQGQLSKSTDLANLSKGILDQAMQATNQIKANAQNQYNSLLTWAANNSQNMGQLQQNIAQIPQAMGQMQIGSGGGVGGGTPYYPGSNASNTKTDIFGQPIQV